MTVTPFRRPIPAASNVVALPLPVVPDAAAFAPLEGGEVIDLSGKRKLILVAGPRDAGKTLFLRWLIEHIPPEAEWTAATVDPDNRDLPDYFVDRDGQSKIAQPEPGQPAAEYLEQFIQFLAEDATTSTGIIDLGGRDRALLELIRTFGNSDGRAVIDMLRKLNAAPIEPVLIVMLSHRVRDLAVLRELLQVGFLPPASLLIKNLREAGTNEYSFTALREDPAFLGALAAGAVSCWMPHCRAAAALTARTGLREGFASLGIMGRIGLTSWLKAMDTMMAPFASWRP